MRKYKQLKHATFNIYYTLMEDVKMGFQKHAIIEQSIEIGGKEYKLKAILEKVK